MSDTDNLVGKLDRYEQKAYEGGCGNEYLSELGGEFKYYIINCRDKNKEPTFEGWIAWIDRFSKGFLETE